MRNFETSKPRNEAGMAKVEKIKPVYSGPSSKKFWEQVNLLPWPIPCEKIYKMGCELQDLENQVLDLLNAERLKATRDR